MDRIGTLVQLWSILLSKLDIMCSLSSYDANAWRSSEFVYVTEESFDALQMAETEADVVQFMQRTLCAVQCQSLNVNIANVTLSLLQRLIDDGLVLQKKNTDAAMRLDVTRLGKAVYKGKRCIVAEL